MSRGTEPTEYLEHTGQPTDPPQPIGTRQHATKAVITHTPETDGKSTRINPSRPPDPPDYGTGIPDEDEL
jgi:hypothetical protein